MNIYLVRHGIAIDREDAKSPPEADRFLTTEGLLKTRAAAKGMAALSLTPRLVLSSPWLRARQTAEIVMEEQKIDVGRLLFSSSLLWDANPLLLLNELKTRQTVSSILCVGHAPHLDHFLAYCLGTKTPFTSMKKASLAHLVIDTFDAGGSVLEALYPPKALRLIR
jgi:phosphohistidine phosphatase